MLCMKFREPLKTSYATNCSPSSWSSVYSGAISLFIAWQRQRKGMVIANLDQKTNKAIQTLRAPGFKQLNDKGGEKKKLSSKLRLPQFLREAFLTGSGLFQQCHSVGKKWGKESLQWSNFIDRELSVNVCDNDKTHHNICSSKWQSRRHCESRRDTWWPAVRALTVISSFCTACSKWARCVSPSVNATRRNWVSCYLLIGAAETIWTSSPTSNLFLPRTPISHNILY